MALKRHKHHIGNRYIEVYRANAEDFLQVAGGATCEAAAFLSRGAQVIVRMRGLPYDASAQQVLEFFKSSEAEPVEVLDGEEGVLFVRRADGRATGDAFVLFAKEEDCTKALSRHRKLIGSRYIELFRSTTAEVQQVLNRSLETRTSTASTPSTATTSEGLLPVAILPQHVITSGTAKDCIRLRGLPYEAQVDSILKFLDEFAKHIAMHGVHMVYNAQGQASGEAFIQMDSEASAFHCAQQKHNRFMFFGKKQRYIEVFQCSGDDMNQVLTGGVAPAASPKLLSPGTLVSPPPPPAPAPRILAQQIAHQTLLARQQENLILASLRPQMSLGNMAGMTGMLPMLPTYSTLRPTSPYPLQQMMPQAVPTKRSYERAFAQAQTEQSPAKRAFTVPPPMAPALSLPMFSYGSSTPIFTYANSGPMLSYASAMPGLPSGLPAGYGALSAAMPPSLGNPFQTLSMFPTYPYYPGV